MIFLGSARDREDPSGHRPGDPGLPARPPGRVRHRRPVGTPLAEAHQAGFTGAHRAEYGSGQTAGAGLTQSHQSHVRGSLNTRCVRDGMQPGNAAPDTTRQPNPEAPRGLLG